jgi:glycerol-3-phosphate acyltransferase PlsY
MLPAVAFWTGLGFLLGSMPFSVWLGRWILGTDIRRYGDGNPGAMNAWRAGKWRVGVPASLLDYLKGAVPVSLARFGFGVSGWGLVPVALAPVLGHAFTPFLHFRGGKAIAATFGIWTGLTLWEGPTILGGLFAVFLLVQSVDAWAVILGMICLLAFLLARGADTITQAVWAGNLLVLVWKHRHDLRNRPRLRPYLLRILGRLR